MKKALLLYNPMAGRRPLREEDVAWIEEQLRGLGMEVQKQPTRSQALPSPPAGPPPDLLVVAGGDGTIHQALGLLQDWDVPLAVLPAGTVNVLARELGIPLDWRRALSLLEEGRQRPIYPGLGQGRAFHLMAGVGLDARVIERVTSPLKRRLGTLAYWWKGLLACVDLPVEPVEVRLQEQTYLASFVVISRIRRYGGRILLTPQADPSQPLLDVCLFQGRSRSRFLLYLLTSLQGRHTRLPDVHYVKVPQLQVEGPSHIPVQMDGELVGRLPMEFSCRRKPIRVLVP